ILNALGENNTTVAAALRSIGISPADIAAAFRDVLGIQPFTMGQILGAIGDTGGQIADALANGYNLNIPLVYNFFHTVQAKGANEIATIISHAGYDLNQVKQFFTNLGDSIKDWFHSVFG